ncbi:MAG: FGGY family carbohydrate kinase, partial [Candidatus Omnitrophota bacterium]|nr:FGGY family carbohydrate kinase [Candidatus Omnitrophota bacterium]
MKYILSIDQGTTGSRAYIFDKCGRIVSSAYKELGQIYPQASAVGESLPARQKSGGSAGPLRREASKQEPLGGGWVEHDPNEIWRSVKFVIRRALSRKNIRPAEIAAVGIANQRETTILWDRYTGRPVHNAIVWQCRRTAGICDKLKRDGYAELFRKKTGLVIDAYFSGTKIKWLLDNIKGLQRRAEKGEICFGTVDTWLIWKLTGGKAHATDYTNASRTLCFNIKDKKWDEGLLKIMKIPHAILPGVKASSSIFGKTAKNTCGLISGIPIAGDAGDQQAALFGQGCFAEGNMKNTYGTGCFLLLNTGQKPMLSKKGLLTTLACDIRGNPNYALEGSVFITGAAVQW